MRPWLRTIEVDRMGSLRELYATLPYQWVRDAIVRGLLLRALRLGICPLRIVPGCDGGCWRPIIEQFLLEGEHIG